MVGWHHQLNGYEFEQALEDGEGQGSLACCSLLASVRSPCSPRDSQESSPTPQFKESILWCSAFFMIQFSHPHMTTGKTIALTRQIVVGKVMSMLFNMLSMLVIAFLSRSKCLLISPSTVIWESKNKQIIKICHCSFASLSICHKVMGP